MAMSKKHAKDKREEVVPEKGAVSDGGAGDAGRTPPPPASASAVEALTPLEEARAEAEKWKVFAQRAQAEFENTKKRLEAQQFAALERASERVLTGLIPVMDDLEYGIAHAHLESDAGTGVAAGLEAIYAKLAAVFAAEGVEVLDPTGQPFDHNTAQAVQMVEDAHVPDQTVTQTLQKGYVMGGSRVLRAAMVVVSTVPAGAGADEADGGGDAGDVGGGDTGDVGSTSADTADSSEGNGE